MHARSTFSRILFNLLALLMLATATAPASAQMSAQPPAQSAVEPRQYDPTLLEAAAPELEQTRAGERKAFIWEVRSATNTVYLFGTIHVGKRSFYPLPDAVEDALKNSASLVVEADITKIESDDDVRPLIAFRPPLSLESQVPAPLYHRLQRQLIRLKLPADGLRELKPYIAGGFIAIAEFTRLGYDRNFGVDAYLLAAAQREQKPILELESQLGQLKMFDAMPQPLQEAFLDNALTSIETGKTIEQVTGMVNAWQSGDAKLMQTVAGDVSQGLRQSAEIEELLVYSRHPLMMKKIEGFLAGKQPYFVAVGSLHLVGPRGLVELLRAKGYAVRQL